MTKPKKATPPAKATLREPTERERKAISEAREAQAARPTRPAVDVLETENRTMKVQSQHADEAGCGALLVKRRPKVTPDRRAKLTPLALGFAVARRRSAEPSA